MNKSTICTFLVALLCLFVAANGHTQDKKMYSWTDENGTVHFSESRPDGQDVREQSIPQGAPPATNNPYQDVDAGPSYAQQRRDEIAQKNEDAQANKAVKDIECTAWQTEVDRLEPNRRDFYTNDEGETVRMDDVERTNRVANLKSEIAKNCK
jgi:hypothetical protein